MGNITKTWKNVWQSEQCFPFLGSASISRGLLDLKPAQMGTWKYLPRALWEEWVASHRCRQHVSHGLMVEGTGELE